MSNIFIETAWKLGRDIITDNTRHAQFVQLGGIGSEIYHPHNKIMHKLLMLTVLEKMGWGIDYYPKTAAPGWWFGSLEFEAQGPFAFSDLPEAVCKAFVGVDK